MQKISEKEKKYDRQLRLWAANGQEALEQADILLINSGPGVVGVETLKNLVLPGIGKFTIIDSAKVSICDLGVNFFLDESSLGKSRAEYCVKFLKELNEDVEGEFYSTLDVAFLQSLLTKRCFTFILCMLPIQADILSFIKTHTNETKTPLILSHSVGFYSYFRSILPVTIPIVDTHPEPGANIDLRLLNPWKELSEFCETLTEGIDEISNHKHSHIPYVALLLYYLKEWKQTNGKWPNSYAEKIEFKKKLAAGARKTSEGNEENFDEAIAAVMKNVRAPILSSAAIELFEYQPNDFEANSNFWIIADAVKQFYEKYKLLPLPGSIPDMKSESKVYVRLQNIYKAKARQDVAEIFDIILGHPNGKSVQITEVENFCKNAAHIKLTHSFDKNSSDIKAIAKTEFENDEISAITSQPMSLLPIYLVLNATSHLPTLTSNDIIKMIGNDFCIAKSSERIQRVAEEVARAKGGQLHNISALTGGMIAQEVIKLITRQYVPIDNTCIFDGITSRVQVLKI